MALSCVFVVMQTSPMTIYLEETSFLISIVFDFRSEQTHLFVGPNQNER